MVLNPYESPKANVEPPARMSPGRARAVSRLRSVFVILLLPAIYNYLSFDIRHVSGSPLSALFRTVNVLGFLIGGALIWCLGVPLLERIAGAIRLSFAHWTDADKWNELLYTSIDRALYLAIPGAVLWAIWVCSFYQLQVNFLTISYAVGIPAHLLGACFYLPLFFRWYKLARSSRVAQ